MPNPFFRFKQFTVYHDLCAMKVGTDGVLLGGWVDIRSSKYALDIGTGSGLIALMLAQRNSNLEIHAIDIDKDAVRQAKKNIQDSPFSTQIICENIPLQELAENTSMKYELIVSNPPFFENSLKSPDKQRTLARHTDSLSINELIQHSSKLLSDNGKLSFIYPYEYRENIISSVLKSELSISKITNVYPKPDSEAKRILIELTKKETDLKEDDLIIEKQRHIYSDEFSALVKDFYLKL